MTNMNEKSPARAPGFDMRNNLASASPYGKVLSEAFTGTEKL